MTDPGDDAFEDVAEPADDAFENVTDDVTDDSADLGEDAKALLDAILDGSGETVRAAVRYSGDDVDLLYVRDDIDRQFSDAELAERVKTLVVQGMGDPVEEGALFDFGTLDATVRWYNSVVVASFPLSDWSGLVFTFDRVTESLLDLAEDHFGA